MPVAAVVAIVAMIIAYIALHALMHVLAAHLAMAVACTAGGAILLAAALVALMRGAMHHTVIHHEPWARPSLPEPARRQGIPAAPAGRTDPFSSGPAAWEELAEMADREELERPGPREARIALLCEGPECRGELGDAPWEVEVASGEEREEHLFCSGECAAAWREADQGAAR